MNSIQLVQEIREFFIDKNFNEIPSVPILLTNSFYNPNLLHSMGENSVKFQGNSYVSFSNILNVRDIPVRPIDGKNLFKPHITGIYKGEQSITELMKDFFHKMLKDNSFFELIEASINYSTLGLTIDGWELKLDGSSFGNYGYITRFANKPIRDLQGLQIFDINLENLYLRKNVENHSSLDQDFSQYLMNYSSKRVLFELFDNYMDETIYCVRNNLKFSALTFLTHCYSIYELLIIKGYISKTEKIGYDTKMNKIVQRCIET